MIKIYFTASTTFDGDLKEINKKIIELIKANNGQIISGQQIVEKKLLSSDQTLPKKKIFEREKKLIEQADCIIAEVTKPSLGVGGEIVYSLINRKPVLALLAEEKEDKISPMVAGNPSDNLFLENYHLENIEYKIKNFLNYVDNLKKRKGVLIVIDGGDGSGKTTQAMLLVEYLKKTKKSVKYFDFPQYYNSFHGKTVAKFLRGEFGRIDEVSPYLASLAYALDRASVKAEMDDSLNHGGIIITNRYATSNMAHQAAKFNDPKQQEEYLKWIMELEYKVHKIPKENIVIYLYVPWQIGMELTKTKQIRYYLNGENADIHEKDLLYRQAVEKMYLFLSNKYKHWVKIDCVVKNQLLTPQQIHSKILATLRQNKII